MGACRQHTRIGGTGNENVHMAIGRPHRLGEYALDVLDQERTVDGDAFVGRADGAGEGET